MIDKTSYYVRIIKENSRKERTMNNKISKKSMLALFMCVCLSLVLSLSYLYVFTHIKHQCTQSECPVCERIQVAAHMIEQIRNTVLGIAVLITAVFFACYFKKITYLFIVSNTPVRNKVRLNN